MSWQIANGPIPDGMCVMHRCDNPPCVNPAHLTLGTLRDNNRDMHRKGRNSYTPRFGNRNHATKVTDAQVRDIRNRYTGAFGQIAALGREYGISGVAVSAIVRQRSHRLDHDPAGDNEGETEVHPVKPHV